MRNLWKNKKFLSVGGSASEPPFRLDPALLLPHTITALSISF